MAFRALGHAQGISPDSKSPYGSYHVSLQDQRNFSCCRRWNHTFRYMPRIQASNMCLPCSALKPSRESMRDEPMTSIDSNPNLCRWVLIWGPLHAVIFDPFRYKQAFRELRKDWTSVQDSGLDESVIGGGRCRTLFFCFDRSFAGSPFASVYVSILPEWYQKPMGIDI